MLKGKYNFLFLSGWAFKKESLLRLAKGLSEAIDSSFELHSSCNFVADNREKSLCPDTIIIGWSMGALLAIELYLKQPEKVKGIILLSGTASFCNKDSSIGVPHQNVRAMKLALKRFPEQTVEDFLKLASYPFTFPDKMKDYLLDVLDKKNMACMAMGLDYLMKSNFCDVLHKILCPVLVMATMEDKVIPCLASKMLAENLPEGCFKEIQNTSHIFPLLEPEVVTKHIICWLKDFF